MGAAPSRRRELRAGHVQGAINCRTCLWLVGADVQGARARNVCSAVRTLTFVLGVRTRFLWTPPANSTS